MTASIIPSFALYPFPKKGRHMNLEHQPQLYAQPLSVDELIPVHYSKLTYRRLRRLHQ